MISHNASPMIPGPTQLQHHSNNMIKGFTVEQKLKGHVVQPQYKTFVSCYIFLQPQIHSEGTRFSLKILTNLQGRVGDGCYR